MTLAFLAYRRGFLKHITTVATAAIARGHTVVLLLDPYANAKPGEGIREDAALDLRAAIPGAVIERVHPRQTWLEALRAWRPDAIVGASLPHALKSLGENPSAWCGVAPLVTIDAMWDVLSDDLEAVHAVDLICYATDAQQCRHEDLLSPRHSTTARAVTGAPWADHLVLAGGDGPTRRRHFGLREDRPVVTLMTLKLGVGRWGDERWRFAHLGGYRALVRSLRAFADRHDAQLVIKGRPKHLDPSWLHRAADLYIAGDEVETPYTSARVIAMSDLVVHFGGGATLECAAAGIPGVHLTVPQPHLAAWPSAAVVYDELRSPGDFTIEAKEGAELLSGSRLDDFRDSAIPWAPFRDRYIGPVVDGKNGERVVDAIEVLR